MGGGKKTSVVGYRYYFGIHMGVGRGPVDELHEVKVGERTAWYGAVDDNAAVAISAPELFGGDEKEGGIDGTLEVMMGGPSQVASAGLQAMLGSTLPGFRRMFTLFFNGQIASNNPYPKPWKFRFNRILQGWDGAVFYPDKARIPLMQLPSVDADVRLLTRFANASTLDQSSFAIGAGVLTGTTATLSDGRLDIQRPFGGPSGLSYQYWANDALRRLSGEPFSYEFIFNVAVTGSPYEDANVVRIVYPATEIQITMRPDGAIRMRWYLDSVLYKSFTTTLTHYNEDVHVVVQWLADHTFSFYVNGERMMHEASVGAATTPPIGGLVYLENDTVSTNGLTVSHRAVRVAKKVFYSGTSFEPPTPIDLVGDAPVPGTFLYSMNPAHIIYECLTNREWGRGMSASRIDEASFEAAADQLSAEQFGLCMKWTRQDEIQSFVQSVLDHIGASLFTSRETGLMKLKLIRGDYDLDSIPFFDDESGLLEVREYTVGTIGKSVNSVTVKWHDPIEDEDRAVTVNNPASLLAAGGVSNGVTKEYKGLPTAALASRVAQRDLRAVSSNLKRLTLVLDRRGEDIEPGSVIAIRDNKRGIPKTAFRVGRIEDGTITDGRITVSVVQDVFSLPESAFAAEVPNTWTPPNTTPCIPAHQRVVEAPYFMLARDLTPADLDYVSADGGYILAMSARGKPLNLGYKIHVRDAASTPDDDPPNDTYVCET